MKYKYSIDRIKINKINDRYHIVLNGWCFIENENVLNIGIKMNNHVIYENTVAIPRKDVCKKYSLNSDNLLCGFRIFVDTECLYDIELIVKVKNKSVVIKTLTKESLKKYIRNETVEYAVDNIGFNEKTNVYTINGWAFSYLNEKIEYSILDKNNKEMEINHRLINRSDLLNLKIVDENNKYCGYMITFPGKKDEKYYLRLKTQTSEEYIDLMKVNKTSLKAMLKGYFGMLNKENIEKGIKYFKKNGVKKFLKRLREGPSSLSSYADWFERNKVSNSELEIQKNRNFDYSPKISIIVPTYNTPIVFLNEMIESVIAQSYSNWELCIADGSDENNEARKRILEYVNADSRIKVTFLEENYGISGNTNKALEIATGDYVGLFDHDDLLTPDALYEIVNVLQDVKRDIIYTDEDKLDNSKGIFVDPNFKPDYNVDLFRSHNYITHFFVVKSDIIKGIGGFDSQYDGAQDYDLMFRCIEKAKDIYHVPKILYHWRMHEMSTAENPKSKLYAYDAGKRAIEAHYQRIGVDATVEMMPEPLWGLYKTTYSINKEPLVSIVIPNMEHKDVLETCINSLYNVNNYKNFEVIIIENNSKCKEIFDYYEELQNNHDNLKVVKWDGEFNYSAINNYGVTFTKGDYLLFLNNDTEVINGEAIAEMVGCCMRDEVGIVGAKLLYEDNTVQHAGVIIGFGGYAGHIFVGNDKDDYGYMMRARINCDYSAVTAACMLVDRKCFEKVNGFDIGFKVACNDVDFCLRVRELEKLVVFNAFSLWHHYESKSRGYEDSIEKINRFENEVERFQERWKDLLIKGDPYYNINFKIEHGPFVLD